MNNRETKFREWCHKIENRDRVREALEVLFGDGVIDDEQMLRAREIARRALDGTKTDVKVGS
jgi:hypothetical protein